MDRRLRKKTGEVNRDKRLRKNTGEVKGQEIEEKAG